MPCTDINCWNVRRKEIKHLKFICLFYLDKSYSKTVTVSFFPRPNLTPGEETDRLVSFSGEEMDRLVSSPHSPNFEIVSPAGSTDYICVKYGGKSNKIAF